jgi:SAM-dependent methyltransferase
VRIPYSEDVLTSLPSRYDKSYRPNKVYEGYRPNPKGKHPEDWWLIQPIMPSDKKERLGYPTQKPLALLDRIVKASSDEGDTVLDAFCGCGTTLEAAQRLGRRWIGIDISQSALRVVQNRLRKIGAPRAETHNMVQSVQELRELSWQEFQAWAVDAVQGRHSPRKIADMGIDGFTFLEHHPIQVKQMDAVGRPVIDNFVGVLAREREQKGMIIGIGFTKGAIAEVARLEREDKITIDLLTCKQILEEDLPFRTIA